MTAFLQKPELKGKKSKIRIPHNLTKEGIKKCINLKNKRGHVSCLQQFEFILSNDINNDNVRKLLGPWRRRT